jgi:type I restriction enzyme, S subunit
MYPDFWGVMHMKNDSWTEVSIGKYTDLLTGFPFKSTNYVDDPSGIRLLRGDNIVQGELRWNNCKRWTSSDTEQFSKYSLEYNDVVLAMDRPWIEAGLKWAYIKESDLPCLLVQRVSRLRGKNGLLTNFIRYIISEINFTNYVKSVITGINIPHISGPQIQAYRFRLPPINTQKKIASILSNYDDLLENNTRRIEILEEMAKLIYEEWFVKFRFPGHENVKMVPSELGEIPEGWKVKKLEEIAGVNELSIKNGEEPQEINYIDISSVTTGKINEIKCISFADAPSRARRIVKQGDIIWSTVRPNRKSFSIILNPLPNLITSTGFAVITAKNTPYTYLYHALTADDFVGYLTNNATGAAYPAVNTNDFKNANVLVPPNDLLNQFNNIVSDIFDLKQDLLDKNQNLRKTRDLLPPKLISGEINVSEMDIRIRDEFQES